MNLLKLLNLPKYIKNLHKEVSLLKNEVNRLENILAVTEGNLNNLKKNNVSKSEFGKIQIQLISQIKDFICNKKTVVSTTPKRKKDAITLTQAYKLLEEKNQNLFKTWQQLFENGEESYDGLPTHSCSVKGHEIAELFKKYVSVFAEGNVLDIGCGPQGIPIYLEGYPLKNIFGIDPLPPKEKHQFEFEQAICEYIPWEDESFDTLIIGTSFDHLLYLDMAINEILRVLKPSSNLVVWVAFTEGAVKYNPEDKNFKPADSFHMFHFDQKWFEELFEQNFDLINKIDMHDSFFYCYRKTTKS